MRREDKILSILKKTYPRAKVALKFRTPLEMLVSTILSAQCTDKRVNIVTEPLFKKYKSAADYAGADPKTLGRDIKSTGFYRSKAKNIVNSCKIIVNKYRGRVPDSMDALLELPGVARKTANIVLNNAYGIVEGIAVDTHVKRLSGRMGFTGYDDPVKIEQDLMALFPRKEWGRINDLLVTHGREVCSARAPQCAACGVNRFCPSAFKV